MRSQLSDIRVLMVWLRLDAIRPSQILINMMRCVPLPGPHSDWTFPLVTGQIME